MFDGFTGVNPNFELIRDNKYFFNLGKDRMTNHPFIFKDKNGTVAGKQSDTGFLTDTIDMNLSPYTYVCQIHQIMNGTITIKSNFSIIYTNTANISNTSYNLYKEVINETILKWDTIINGVKSLELGKNFKLDITVDIISLTGTAIGSAQPSEYYGSPPFATPYVYGSTFYIKLGILKLNSKKIEELYRDITDSGKSKLYYTVLHEIGHLLGIGTLWSINTDFEAREYIGTFSDNSKYYKGVNALREYKTYFNNQNFIGIPIENNGGAGTMNVHPEEGTEGFTINNTDNYLSQNNRIYDGIFYPGLDNELMSGWSEISKIAQPLSKITIGLLDDLGFVVDYTKADTYIVLPYTINITFDINVSTGTNKIIDYKGASPVGSIIRYYIINNNVGGLTINGVNLPANGNLFMFLSNESNSRLLLRSTNTPVGRYTLSYYITYSVTVSSTVIEIKTNTSTITFNVT
jgi:hypothetical protein